MRTAPRTSRSTSRALVYVFACAVALLGGCATTRSIDSEVRTFQGKAAPASGATFRLERLPSQQSDAKRNSIDAMARAALAQAGLKEDVASARYSVQVSSGVEQFLREVPATLRWRWWMRDPLAPPHPPTYYQGPFAVPVYAPDPPQFRQTARFVMREIASGDIAYETTAVFESGWVDSKRVLPVLMQAALQDFPAAPAGPRMVTLPLPPTTP